MRRKQCILLLYWRLLIFAGPLLGQDITHEIKQSFSNNTYVDYDPSVSALDMYNPNRYNSTEQIPLVAKIATEFTRVFIKLSEVDFENNLQTSMCQSAFAVAEYNKLNTTEHKLQVWLAYGSNNLDYHYRDNLPYHKDPRLILNELISIANKTNAIFSDTVTTIIFPYKLLINNDNGLITNGRLDFLFPSDLQWGFLFETDIFFTYPNVGGQMSTLQPNVLILIFSPITDPSKHEEHVEFYVDRVMNTFNLTSITFAFMFTISDTDSTGKVNMSNLVSLWRHTDKWSTETGYTVVLSKAFDTPVGDTVERKTSGWLRLIENSRYNSTADYKFEEKATLIERESSMASRPSLNWLKKNMKFSKDHVHIVFSLFDRSREKTLQRFSEHEMHSLLENMLVDFNSLVMVLHEDSERGPRVVLYEMQCLNKIFKRNITISIMLLPGVDLSRLFPRDISLAQIKKDFPDFYPLLNSIKHYVAPYEGNQTGNSVKEKILKDVDPSTYSLGILFNISACDSMSAQDWNVEVGQTVEETNAREMVFYFEESKHSVILGATRMFQQRVATMENCRKLVVSSQPNITMVSFMLLHYPTSTEFYSSKRELFSFIEYWKLLSDWARETNSKLILSNIMDAHRHFKGKNEDVTELGWWRLLSAGELKEANKDKNVWVNKLDDALQRYPEAVEETTPSGLGLLALTLIILFLFALFSLVSASVVYYVIRKREKAKEFLSKEEAEEFLKGKEIGTVEGDQSNEALYKLPYNQDQYEISHNSFSIDQNGALGMGEFGIVCRGKIQVPRVGEVNVAIKMVNDKNVHKTTICGFLSEIKVLSFVGKHEHITELIGANTKNVRFGKVFIFLELCELGSLEKYLHKMRPAALAGTEEQKDNSYENLGKYANVVPLKKMQLDTFQCKDLLRWSQEICNGMAYLASKHVVHADLATRNVLLDSNKVAKICDFGLSRRMYNYTNYVKQKQEPLPWKWMAPESLRLMEFNEKTDVWAFGITLWEIFSLGDKPYPGLSWNLEFVDILEGGLRLGRPKYDGRNGYMIMEECWNINPERRPSFSELLLMFD